MPRVDSPNHSARPNEARPRVIVLHATGPGALRGILDWIKTSGSKVSYHGLIASDGTYYSVVSPERAAWHAGVSEWGGVKNINGISLGLAFVNPNDGVTPLLSRRIAMFTAAKEWCDGGGVLPLGVNVVTALFSLGLVVSSDEAAEADAEVERLRRHVGVTKEDIEFVR